MKTNTIPHRVWEYIKNNPMVPATTICTALSLSMSQVTGALNGLYLHKNVERVKLSYYTANAMKVTCYHYKAVVGTVRKADKTTPSRNDQLDKDFVDQRYKLIREAAAKAQATAPKVAVDIDNMTMREAREMYNRLKEVFA